MEQPRKYLVLLELEEEGGFTVRVPALPEIVTFGHDEAEALAMAEDAIRLVLEDRAYSGVIVPLPGSLPTVEAAGADDGAGLVRNRPDIAECATFARRLIRGAYA